MVPFVTNLIRSILNKEAVNSYETLALTYQTTRCHNPQTSAAKGYSEVYCVSEFRNRTNM
jgi:hypothetical protein